MSRNRIIPAVISVMLVAVLSAGCAGNTAEPGEPSTSLTPPVQAAADLHLQGFGAYEKGNYTAALDLYNQAIAADPGYMRAWMDKGNVLIRLNRSEEAVAAFDVVLAYEDDVPNIWNSRGRALMATGNYSAARDSFDQALKQAPDFVEAQENLALVLEKLKQGGEAGPVVTGQV